MNECENNGPFKHIIHHFGIPVFKSRILNFMILKILLLHFSFVEVFPLYFVLSVDFINCRISYQNFNVQISLLFGHMV